MQQQQHPYPMFAAAVGPSPSRGAVLSGTVSRGVSPFPLAPPAPAGAVFGPAGGGAAAQQHPNSSSRTNRSVSRGGNDFQQPFLGVPQAGPPAPAGTPGATQSSRSDNNNGGGHDHGRRGPDPYGGAVLQQQEEQQPQYLQEEDQSQGQPIFNISNINVPADGQPFPSGPPSFPPPTSSSLPGAAASAAAAGAGAVAMNVNAVDNAAADAKTERSRSRGRGEPNAGGRGFGRADGGGGGDNRIGIAATADSAANTATTAGAPPTPSSLFADDGAKAAADPHETGNDAYGTGGRTAGIAPKYTVDEKRSI